MQDSPGLRPGRSDVDSWVRKGPSEPVAGPPPATTPAAPQQGRATRAERWRDGAWWGFRMAMGDDLGGG